MSAEELKFSYAIDHYPFDAEAVESVNHNILMKNLWPSVYILSNKKEKLAYVGESLNVSARLSQHLRNPERKKLNDVHTISCSEFNKSATLEIESNLIKYIAGDGLYQLQNGNAGLLNHNYFQKEDYIRLFKLIWNELREKKLARHSLREIDNSDLFKYSPYKALSDDQYDSLLRIIDHLTTGSPKSVFVEGAAGTGKTILAIFLAKLLITEEANLFGPDFPDLEFELKVRELKRQFPKPKIALVVPMSSLRQTLKYVFKNINGLSAKMVIGPSEVFKQDYDILLVDEAHRLRRRYQITNYGSFDENNRKMNLGQEGTELDWILGRSKKQVIFYDANQSIKPSDIPVSRMNQVKGKSALVQLSSQFRVKGGMDYIAFVDDLLKNNLSPATTPFNHQEYELILFEHVHDMVDAIRQKEEEFGLSRLIAGYAWQWASKKNNAAFDVVIDGTKLRWNSEFNDWINSPKAKNEVGCIHTTQGYDLNYAGIIFGKEISYDPTANEIVIRKEHYHDKKGKAGITDPEELKAYIINIYKTLMYRGIRGTYVYVCDKNLRAYFRKHLSLY